MLGLRYIKAGPIQYILHYKNGQVIRSGTGLVFFDGVEADYLAFNSGTLATVGIAAQRMQLVVG